MNENKKILFSLEDQDVITKIQNMFSPGGEHKHEHNSDLTTLGFGCIHYSLVKNIKAKKVLAIGSRYGFIPACIALALRSNKRGKLDFVDANFNDDKDGLNKGYGGVGYWNKNKKGSFDEYDIGKHVDMHIMTTKEFFSTNVIGKTKYDYIYIDGDHSYNGFRYDFEEALKRLSKTGIISCHDVLVEEGTRGYKFGVGKFLSEIDRNQYSVITIPVWPGISLIQKAYTYGQKSKK